jgi:phosphoribosylanthranilate isomerase
LYLCSLYDPLLFLRLICGSGKKIKQQYLEDLSFSKPWWIAGGVSTDWIGEILKNIKPSGIDISSSVETAPGIKDIQKVGLIIKEVRKY